MERMPVLFIGHGSPMNVILDNEYTRHLARLGASLPRPSSVLVVSARRDHAALIAYDRAGAAILRAVPTNDHYLPMLYAIGLQEPGEPLAFTHEGIQNGSVSMRCIVVG